MRIMDKLAISPWFYWVFSSFLKFLKREVGGVLSPRRRVRWGLGYGLMAPTLRPKVILPSHARCGLVA
jgi:hypothetical protein